MANFSQITNKLPEDWTANQIISPNGTEAGYDEAHGYNYLMKTVNKVVAGVNQLGKDFSDVDVDKKIKLHNVDKGAHPYLVEMIQSLTYRIASVPTQKGTLIYSGKDLSPEWSDYDSSKLMLGGVTSGTDVGSYTATFTPIDPYKWADGTQDAKNATWEICRAYITDIPVQSGTLTYNGEVLSPTWENYDTTKMTLGGVTSGTNVGVYNASFTPTENYQWKGGNTGERNVPWSISRAEGSLSLDKTALSLSGMAGITDTIIATRLGDGAIVAVSADEHIATVTVTGVTVIVTAVNDGSTTISISAAAGTNYAATAAQTVAVSVELPKVFGVCWDMGNSSTSLSRLTAANDPNAFATVTISSEPAPAVGAGSGSSPFDNYAPWKDMDEYNVVNGAIGVKKGESGFSRSSDTVVYIPVFWYKVINDASNGKRYFYISDKAKSGFTQHPGSGRYVGRYNTGSGYVSQTGKDPLASITRESARSDSKSKGANWYQYDYASWCAICLLYLIEFADWDCQSQIGRGYVDSNSSAIRSGGTDSMVYHTGRAAGIDGATAVQYRHIENLWGNLYDWVDGVNFSDGTMYVCTNPANYADDIATNYTKIGTKVQSDGYISGLGYSSATDWGLFPTAISGSESSYIPDYAFCYSNWTTLCVGGYWNNGSYAGLFNFCASGYSSRTSSDIGTRLIFIP